MRKLGAARNPIPHNMSEQTKLQWYQQKINNGFLSIKCYYTLLNQKECGSY
jgi:hypothetical protein